MYGLGNPVRKSLLADHGQDNTITKAHAVAGMGVVARPDLDHRVVFRNTERYCFSTIAVYIGIPVPVRIDPYGDESGAGSLLGRVDNALDAERLIKRRSPRKC